MVFFDWGKPDLRGDDQAMLDQVVAAYRSKPGTRLQLTGHSDRSGSTGVNRATGLRRAINIRVELEKRGIPRNAMSIASFGEDKPLIPTEDGVREVQNRRVEIAFLGAEARTATLIDGTGRAIGSVAIEEDPGHATLTLSASGLTPGEHGAHLHAVGRCDGPGFQSAGAHWNPTNRKHGMLNPEGAHMGDLMNVEAGADGKATATLHVGGGPLADMDGTSLVIHAKPDDNMTDPSGNSGDRIACAVLAPAP
jgi:Cu-Zn family superoxide dismutase